MANIKQNLEVFINAKNNASGAFKALQQDSQKAFGQKGGGGLIGMSTGATMALGAAVAGVGALAVGLGKSVGVAADFEQSMAKVKAITGATGDSFSGLEQLAKDLGSSTSFSASQAAEGIQFLGMAGLSTDEIMTALPSTLNLASAGAMDLGSAADIASNIMSGMGLQADDLTHVVDGLAQASRKSNTDVTQLGEGFKYVATTSSQAGLDFDQTTAALGMLANAGLQASMGGTSLNSALIQMLKPSDEAKKAAERLGLQFTDNEGKVRPLVEITKDLEDANVSAKDMVVLFGRQGGRAMGALKQQGSEALAGLETSLRGAGGVAQEMAETQMGTFQGALKGLSSATEGLMISVGEKLLPVLTDLVKESIIPAVQSFNSWIGSIGRLNISLKVIGDSIVKFATGAFKVVDAIFTDPNYRTKFMKTINGVFASAFTLLKNFVRNWGTIVLNWAGVVWEPVGQAFGMLWDYIKQEAAEGWNKLGPVFADGINTIIKGINLVGEVFGTTIDEIDFTPITVDAPKTLEERWAETKENVKTRFNNITDAASQMASDIKADSDNLKTDMGKAFEVAAEQAGEELKAIETSYSQEVAKPIVDESHTTGKKAGTAIVTEAAEVVEKQGKIVGSGLTDHVQKALGDAFLDLAQGKSLGSVVSQAAVALGTAFAGPLGGAVAGAITRGLTQNNSKRAAKGVAGMALEGGRFDLIDQGAIRKEFKGGNLAGTTNKLWDVINKEFSSASETEKKAIFVGMLAMATGKQSAMNDDGIAAFNAAMEAELVRRAAADIDLGNRRSAFNESIQDQAMDLIPAATGFSGKVSKPTLFLAGEAGPENVNISPTSEGFRGGMGGTVFQITVNSLDPRGVKDLVEGELGDIILRRLREDSFDNRELMSSGGLVN